MQIVTDSGTDIYLSAEERAELKIHVVPLVVTLDGKSYREGLDITTEAFYPLLEASGKLPTTSQPSAGDFAAIYRTLAEKDPEILSIHLTAGLSGTFNSAIAGAQMVPEAKVTHVNTKTLSAAAGWQVKAAAHALKAGWALDKILPMLQKISNASESIYTLQELKYLIHGGRISHMKGLIASLLNIKPIIGVEKVNGTYVQKGQARTFNGAVKGLVDKMLHIHPEGSELHVQVLHAFNPEGGAMLREMIEQRFKCHWLPMGPMSLVLGAHTGRSMVGVAYAARAALAGVPGIA
ncbi:MAG: DegV family protein [Anaerolineales bacterium]|nr:DegV family protein [Anaerolineales bacterium]